MVHLPEMACSTGEVYRRFDRLPEGQRALAARDPTALAALAELPPSRWRDRLANDLAAALALSDDLRRLHGRLTEAAGAAVSITGSGSAMFVLCDDAREAAAVVRRLPADLPGRTVLVRDNPW